MYRFGVFAVDPERFLLSCNGQPVHLEPQVYDLLLYLIRNRDRVVAKEELLDAIWGDRFVSESALTSRVKAARRAIGDDGGRQQLIHTVRQRGYRFVGDVVQDGEPHPAVPTTTSEPPDSAPEEAAALASQQEIAFCRGADGVRIAYASLGDGPPLVKAANWITHLGYDLASPVWRHWLTALADGRRLVRYDERGCGLSEWNVDSLTFEDWVRDLETVVQACGLSSFPLLGISQGAAVAVAYAARYPEQVQRLVLISGYATGRLIRASTEDERRAAALDLDLARVGWGKDDPVFRRVFAMQFFPDGTPQQWTAFDELQRRTTSPSNAVRFLEEFAVVDVRAFAPRVRCPTLVLHSAEDTRQPFVNGQQLADLIPGSRLVPVPSRNHLITENEPAFAMLMDELNAFLDEA